MKLVHCDEGDCDETLEECRYGRTIIYGETGWLTLIAADTNIEHHFCSLNCLNEWSGCQ